MSAENKTEIRLRVRGAGVLALVGLGAVASHIDLSAVSQVTLPVEIPNPSDVLRIPTQLETIIKPRGIEYLAVSKEGVKLSNKPQILLVEFVSSMDSLFNQGQVIVRGEPNISSEKVEKFDPSQIEAIYTVPIRGGGYPRGDYSEGSYGRVALQVGEKKDQTVVYIGVWYMLADRHGNPIDENGHYLPNGQIKAVAANFVNVIGRVNDDGSITYTNGAVGPSEKEVSQFNKSSTQ